MSEQASEWMTATVIYVHPDGTPDEDRLEAHRITVKTWPVERSRWCAAVVKLRDRRGRIREARFYAAVTTITTRRPP